MSDEQKWRDHLRQIEDIAINKTKDGIGAFAHKQKKELKGIANDVYTIERELGEAAQRVRKLRASLGQLEGE